MIKDDKTGQMFPKIMSDAELADIMEAERQYYENYDDDTLDQIDSVDNVVFLDDFKRKKVIKISDYFNR